MSNTGGLGLGFGGGTSRGPLDAGASERMEHVLIQRPLSRVLMLCRRSIDDVVNSPLVKNEVLGYWKVYKQLHRRAEVLQLERQWNPLGL
jgi:hypothetical protein